MQDATTIRVRGGEVVIADGPFAETKEQIAGFDILECADLDEAMEVAAKHPVTRFGVLELRPFLRRNEPRRDVEGRSGLPEVGGRIVAALIRRTGNWDLAEDCAQQAFTETPRLWPREGIPGAPGLADDRCRPPSDRPAAPRTDAGRPTAGGSPFA